MPAARTHQQRRDLLVELVLLAVPGSKRHRAADRVARFDLAMDLVVPRRRVASPRSRSCTTSAPEFSALMTILRSTGPVISTRRHCRSFGTGAIFQSPSRIALRLGQEVGPLAGVEPPRAVGTRRQQFLAARLEGAVQLGDELERLGGQDGLKARPDFSRDLHSLRQRQRTRHDFSLFGQVTGMRMTMRGAKRLAWRRGSRARAARLSRGAKRVAYASTSSASCLGTLLCSAMKSRSCG